MTQENFMELEKDFFTFAAPAPASISNGEARPYKYMILLNFFRDACLQPSLGRCSATVSP